MLKDANDWFSNQPSMLSRSVNEAFIAEVFADMGERRQADAHAGEALECAKRGDRIGEIWALRARGIAAANHGTTALADAVEWLQASVELAESRGSSRDVALGRLASGRALGRHGKIDAARRDLTIAADFFRDHDMAWYYRQARVLLDELAP